MLVLLVLELIILRLLIIVFRKNSNNSGTKSKPLKLMADINVSNI